MIIKGLTAYTILICPPSCKDATDAKAYDTQEEVGKWFTDARNAGYIFQKKDGYTAAMLKGGAVEQIVWIENPKGVKLSLDPWIE